MCVRLCVCVKEGERVCVHVCVHVLGNVEKDAFERAEVALLRGPVF